MFTATNGRVAAVTTMTQLILCNKSLSHKPKATSNKCKNISVNETGKEMFWVRIMAFTSPSSNALLQSVQSDGNPENGRPKPVKRFIEGLHRNDKTGKKKIKQAT